MNSTKAKLYQALIVSEAIKIGLTLKDRFPIESSFVITRDQWSQEKDCVHFKFEAAKQQFLMGLGIMSYMAEI